MAVIPFIKASACGNDFLLVQLSDVAPHGIELPELAKRMCDRHEGIGADGVEFLLPDTAADVEAADMRAKLINADGSFAEVSGNGSRCVAAWLAEETGKQKIAVRTDAGVKTCTLVGRDAGKYEFEAAMGLPRVDEEAPLRVAAGEVLGLKVSMGNPHYVIFVRKFAVKWQAEGAEISTRPEFEHGTNVEFVHVRDRSNIAVRFYERGAGETRSSGTGSCAAAVAAIHSGKATSPVTIHTQGGVQTVRWEGEVFLKGPARIVCRGDFFI
jgi:diaminopimelate epimerase